VTGKLLPFRPGIGLLLHRFPRPAVPVYVRGTFEAWPRGRRWPRRRPVTVVFGTPLDPRRLVDAGASPEAAARAIARALQAAVAELERSLAPGGPHGA
jgi:long-chain acyl-CoA synthetase